MGFHLIPVVYLRFACFALIALFSFFCGSPPRIVIVVVCSVVLLIIFWIGDNNFSLVALPLLIPNDFRQLVVTQMS